MPRPPQQLEPVYRTYDGVEYEVLPLSLFGSSPLASTSSAILAASVTIEDEEHEDRVLHAKKARACVKRPFGKPQQV